MVGRAAGGDDVEAHVEQAARRIDQGRLVPVAQRNEDRARERNAGPNADQDLARARSKSRAMPMTSPVERISGPSTVSTPGKRLKGNTTSLTATWLSCCGFRENDPIFAPAMTLAPILAMGTPVVLATNGAVREARGFTSRM